MLRVLHVGKYYPPVAGGMERVVQMLCGVAPDRLESSVLAFSDTRSTREEIVDGVRVTRVGTLGHAGSVPIAPTFAAHLRAARADVMIVHEPNPWALLSLLAARSGIPFAIWYHSDVVRPGLQYSLFYAPVARPIYRRARKFVVSSPALAATSPTLARYASNVTIIPFGIDPAAWELTTERRRRAAELRAASGRPIVLFLGRLVPYKGVDVLIRATAPLDVRLVVAGTGPMRDAWQHIAEANHARADVSFTGSLDDEEAKSWVHAADVLVLPSVTPAEAFGLVQLEAMAAGTPVISTSVASGVSWVNRHGETGLVVPPGDSAALRGALETLLRDASLRARLGAAGRARVHADFSMREMGNRLVAVCKDVVAGAGQ